MSVVIINLQTGTFRYGSEEFSIRPAPPSVKRKRRRRRSAEDDDVEDELYVVYKVDNNQPTFDYDMRKYIN